MNLGKFESFKSWLISAGIAVANGLTWEAALRAITRAPAELYGVADQVGSIEAGKRADLVIWPLNEPGPSGAWDPVASLLLSPPTTARDVMVEGRWVVRDGHLASADLSAICEAARRSRKRLMELA